jgi:hypothetical protein
VNFTTPASSGPIGSDPFALVGQAAVYTLVFRKPVHAIGPPPPLVATVTVAVLVDVPPPLLAVAVNVVEAVRDPPTCCVFAPAAKPPVHE